MRIGSLFSGYGGLDMGVRAVIGGEVAWHVEYDAAPSKILAHHWPDVPNYGDIRTVDWASVEPVDVLTGGFPCQDVSLAGRRAGITEGTRSGLWSEFAHAIDVLRPGMVVIENVRGLLSATADGALEPDPWGVGDGAARPVVNAFGVVLGDLASLGYDARWCGVRAADAGAPHGRFRVFVLAYPRSDEPERRGISRVMGSATGTGEADREERERVRDAAGNRSDPTAADTEHVSGYGTGRAWDGWTEPANGAAGNSDDAGLEGRPVSGERPDQQSPRPDGVGTRTRGGRVDVGTTEGRSGEALRELCGCAAWGQYAPAIHRWEGVLGRPAPAPTLPNGKDGAHRLSAVAVEFMMGLPAGHVTSPAIGLTRTEQLKALGNGVVPQQAALALSYLMEGVAA